MGLPGQNPFLKIQFFLFVFCYLSLLYCSADDMITNGGSISDGASPQTLVSTGGHFELGFFSPENSSSRYLGIWYSNLPERSVVWIANRENPISDKTGVLTIGNDGNLVILDGKNNSIWTSNVTVPSGSLTAILNDEGNFILSSNDSVGDRVGDYWQSFNDPTDNFLPGMRVEVSSSMGENRAFTSWKSANDPSPGNFIMGVDPRGSPQIVIWEGSERRWRSGHWNLQIFTGIPNMTANLFYGFHLSNEEDGKRYFTYTLSNASDKLRFRIEWDGMEQQLRWEEDNKKWGIMQSQPANECEFYNKCGKFGVCSVSNSPICSCMEGFQPSNWQEWSRGNWSGGCSRRTQLKCQMNGTDTEEDGFEEVRMVKLPDFADLVTLDATGSCEDECLKNCSCIAYAQVTGIGCMRWTGNLLDVQRFSKSGSGNMLNLRLAHSDLSGGKSRISTPVIVVIAVLGAVFLCVLAWIVWRFRLKLKVLPTTTTKYWLRSNDIPLSEQGKSKEFSTDLSGSVDLVMEGNEVSGPDLPLYSFNFVATSTNNFSEENKLGEGGFGIVYKGRLPGGQDIAVKRLSRRSCQGLEEFKNEIIMIAKLQHRNLVRLHGCCIQGDEKMLLYEYMPNKSLDSFLFDQEKNVLLDWRKRFNIIEGIARGLLYLHRDSRLRIIHRDLKASNILLDEEMNPKISDFGMARIFGGNQNEANTNRVVGTYGYMSPEYAMEGLFSVKSDVYSFGILLLEIVSGRKNTSFHRSQYLSLIGYAWDLWKEGKAEELIDPSIADTSYRSEVLRCIQVGILCVQDSPLHRPTMSSVMLMLESEAPNLPLPRQPTFTSMRGHIDTEIFSENDHVSLNDITVTMVDGR
ncbi:hypothetical protein UlMin_011699 [Ulmus minor]